MERIDPDNGNVPEAVIPEDKCLYFQPDEMLELRNFYKREGRDAPFESLQDYAPESYDEDWWALLDHLYSCTAIDMIVAETAAASDPVINRDALVARLLNELPYSLDDYDIIAPQELIDDVLDDNFTDWVGIRNRIALDNALADADFYDYEGKLSCSNDVRLLRLTALSVKYIRELLMSLIPRASKGTDGQYSEPLVNGIVVGGTDKHATNARTLIEGIGVVNTHYVPVK